MLTIANINGRSIDHVSLALAFATVLHEWLDEDEIKQVVERNGTEAYTDYCASHDFCDANMAMLEAIQTLAGLTDDSAALNAQTEGDPDNRLWNDAWSLAKEAGFSTTIGTVVNVYARR